MVVKPHIDSQCTCLGKSEQALAGVSCKVWRYYQETTPRQLIEAAIEINMRRQTSSPHAAMSSSGTFRTLRQVLRYVRSAPETGLSTRPVTMSGMCQKRTTHNLAK